MLAKERHQIIRDRLLAQGRVISGELAQEFGISEDTIRRDLRDLADQGLCQRVYGGAMRPAPRPAPLAQRLSAPSAAKQALARCAAGLAGAGQTIFIDAGSTNVLIAAALAASLRARVVTNAPAVAMALAGHEAIQVILLGGIMDAAGGAALGGSTLAAIAGIRADLFFLGSCGVDPLAGITAQDPAEAEVKRAMLQASARTCVVATEDKLATQAPFRVADLSEIADLVLPAQHGPALLATLRDKGVQLHHP